VGERQSLYECRELFSTIGHYVFHGNATQFVERGLNFQVNFRDAADQSEVLSDTNTRNLTLEFGLGQFYDAPAQIAPPPLVAVSVTRQDRIVTCEYLTHGDPRVRTWEGLTISIDGQEYDFTALGEACQLLANTLYIGPFRNAINIGAGPNYFDLQIGQTFIQTWNSYKAGPNRALRDAALRLQETLRDIFGFRDLQIDASPDGQRLLIAINGRSYPANDVGAGMTQFILVMATAAMRRPSLILVDEPELNLHPALQLDFLATLASYAEVGIMYATHSMGLAKASASARYLFRKVEEGKSQVREMETVSRLVDYLDGLTFSGFNELGFRKILLIEGATDFKAIQQLLKKYEDKVGIVLLPLGGATLIRANVDEELQEIKRITDDVVALIDSEHTAAGAALDPSRQGFVDACARNGIPCHVLDLRALENYWTEEAVTAVKGAGYRALGPYELLRDIAPNWPKGENWQMAREMTREALDTTDLGAFLAGL
jgi:energy-coupling factor transporter ATP-binding protein EcfA2